MNEEPEDRDEDESFDDIEQVAADLDDDDELVDGDTEETFSEVEGIADEDEEAEL